ncbi:MAG TPA: nitronate monooxygenase [Capillimicrobium sp.]|nr:nitronate monooxygenase [Capillimicrobium sp.]
MLALERLPRPIVQAPMAGGPSTPALALAAIEAGGLGFLAAGYRTPEQLQADLDELRAATDRPFGVNLFADPGPPADPAVVERYVAALAGEAGPLGEPRHDDDRLEAKLELLAADPPAVVSFTFGCPARSTVDRLHAAGAAVWVTVTTPGEAEQAAGAGADALVVQGVEAGGHRGGFDDRAQGLVGLLPLLQLVAARVDLPLVATGGLATGAAVAAALAAGASAAQVGTALLRAPEAGTSAPHRAALAAAAAPTSLTRAFSGRLARGIVNRFQREHDDAPSAYPEIHHVTAPLRAAARAGGDADASNLWAGEAYPLAREEPAAAIVERLGDEALRGQAAA